MDFRIFLIQTLKFKDDTFDTFYDRAADYIQDHFLKRDKAVLISGELSETGLLRRPKPKVDSRECGACPEQYIEVFVPDITAGQPSWFFEKEQFLLSEFCQARNKEYNRTLELRDYNLRDIFHYEDVESLEELKIANYPEREEGTPDHEKIDDTIQRPETISILTIGEKPVPVDLFTNHHLSY